MDPASPVSSATSPTSASSLGSLAGNAIDKDKFLQLLVSQIQNQNPLDPVSNEQFVSQLTQFSSLEAQQNTNASLQTLIQLQSLTATISQLSEAASLIGKKIEYLDAQTGAPGTGVVDSVAVENGTVVAKCGSQSVPLILITSLKPNTP